DYAPTPEPGATVHRTAGRIGVIGRTRLLTIILGMTLRHQQESTLGEFAGDKTNQRDRPEIVDPCRARDTHLRWEFAAWIDEIVEVSHSGLPAPDKCVRQARCRLTGPDNSPPAVDRGSRAVIRVQTAE